MRTAPSATLAKLHALADTIEAGGGSVTDAFARTRDRYRAFTEATGRHLPALAEAITAPEPVDLEHLADLHAAALADALGAANAGTRAAVANDIAAAVYRVQWAELRKSAPSNYATARKRYNAAAKKLSAVLAVVDPDTPAEALARADDAARAAWLDVPAAVAEVDAAEAFLLLTAAELGADTRKEAHALALVAEVPAEVDRRALWDAVDAATARKATGRAGKWAVLVRYGATLTAPADPTNVTPYRRPKPIERRYIRVDRGLRPVDYDPETDTPKDAVPVAGMGGINVRA